MTWCDEPHDIIEIYCVFSHWPNRWHMVKTDSSRTICSLGGLWHLASSSNVGFHHRFCSCGSTVKPTCIAGNSHKPEQDRIRWWKCLWTRSWDFWLCLSLHQGLGQGCNPKAVAATDLRRASMFTISKYSRPYMWKKKSSVFHLNLELAVPARVYRQWCVAIESAHHIDRCYLTEAGMRFVKSKGTSG